jgi:pyrrolysyl-tRNA synthetase-like protein
MSPETPLKPPTTRYYRKRVELFRLIDRIKLWPSRQGTLHGIKTIELLGDVARLTTHCGRTFLASNSRNSRAARWLRNKWSKQACAACGVPDWKLEKYASTRFRRHQGSMLRGDTPDGKTISAE